jgi:two-component system, NtrC family, nitrogen regulation response regulator NtrX
VKSKILIIDDDKAVRDSVRQRLEYGGAHQVLDAASGQDGLDRLNRESIDLVVLDIKMPGMDGFETLERIKRQNPQVPIIMLSALNDVQSGFEASSRGAAAFVEKGSEGMGPALQQAIEKELELQRTRERLRSTEDENRSLRQAVDRKYQIVGTSAALRTVEDAIRRAAPTNATVLLQGESGVGKELVARAIHRDSPRSRERFVQVNCAAIPEELIESELFGHEKGSFTGATEKQIGKFEQADRGTIFLDEIGDMSQKTQAKVLRVLQEQEVERLGSARTIKVDVRVIAATNKNLEEAIQRSEFREDLYFRLNVIPIVVPPLRERREDISLLVHHFGKLTSEEHNLKPKKFDAGAMEVLQRYRWRGNIRELRNTIERVMIMTPGDVVRAEDLPRELAGAEPIARSAPAEAVAGAGPASEPRPQPAGTLREFKDAAERAYLVQKLRENNWNISKTADVIDTPRSNLYKKLEQYGIKQEIDG